jgi:hypothetical protein
VELNQQAIWSSDRANFQGWLEGRDPVCLSTNAGAQEVAFQRWRNFKEAFAPELIGQAFEETSVGLGRAVRSCIDPFGGSGTSAVACQFLGVRPVTIEVNPYLADLIEAKLCSYDVDRLIRDFSSVVEDADDGGVIAFPGAPATFVEPGVGGRYVFSRLVARKIASLRERILRVKDPSNRRLLRVMLASVVIPASNVIVSGKGRRYRRNWQTRAVSSEFVEDLFVGSVLRAIFDIRKHAYKSADYAVLRGDARELIPTRQKFDLAVFSPPYPNSFDYTDVYNVELWTCGYLSAPTDNKELRNQTLRSHVQILRSFETKTVRSPTLDETYGRLAAVRSELWNRHIPEMVRAYFGDMATVLGRLRKCIVPKGRLYMVVGDSRYAGVHVPVATILSEIAEVIGFGIAAEEPFRSMRASPQQGGKPELVETLVTLSRS